MSQFEKLLLRLLRGTSDNSIGFQELCGLLAHLGFQMHTRGSHHVFSKLGVAELINLQRDGANAKPYQVKQVRQVIVKYKLEV
ncbi:MAG: type II toxin-antitoxin system HicA family toxin [Comamonadaceae bacterium]|nr:type II toxin-antitoxin system HicA family toxin [Comamonadaceae bacterium]